MKANTLQKESVDIEDIYISIDLANRQGDYKTMIPHYRYISPEVKTQLTIVDGFKTYYGVWDGITNNAFIIEW